MKSVRIKIGSIKKSTFYFVEKPAVNVRLRGHTILTILNYFDV